MAENIVLSALVSSGPLTTDTSREKEIILETEEEKDFFLQNTHEPEPGRGGEGFHPSEVKRMVDNYLKEPIKYKLDSEKEERSFISCDFDKAEVLRILSQDNCEGVRLYMARTNSVKIHSKDDRGRDNLKKVNNENEDIITLVMVGIDKELKDLITRYPQREHNRFKVFMGCSEACGHSGPCEHTNPAFANNKNIDEKHVLLKLNF